jgi:hypothetical protein
MFIQLMHWGTFKYILKQVTKDFIIHLYVKGFLGKKDV